MSLKEKVVEMLSCKPILHWESKRSKAISKDMRIVCMQKAYDEYEKIMYFILCELDGDDKRTSKKTERTTR